MRALAWQRNIILKIAFTCFAIAFLVLIMPSSVLAKKATYSADGFYSSLDSPGGKKYDAWMTIYTKMGKDGAMKDCVVANGSKTSVGDYIAVEKHMWSASQIGSGLNITCSDENSANWSCTLSEDIKPIDPSGLNMNFTLTNKCDRPTAAETQKQKNRQQSDAEAGYYAGAICAKQTDDLVKCGTSSRPCTQTDNKSEPSSSSVTYKQQCERTVKNGIEYCSTGAPARNDRRDCLYSYLNSEGNLYDLTGMTQDQAREYLAEAKKQGDAARLNKSKAQDSCNGNLREDGTCEAAVAANDTTATSKACKQDIAGWILCPLAQGLGGLVDGAYGIIGGWMLEINSKSIFDADGGGFSAYKTFLPIANIILAIMFLLIIYSEATGNGFGALTNYSVKKLLPKVIVYAIIVNISWWLCAAAVDISNILGANLTGMFGDITDKIPQPSGAAAWANIAILAIGGVGGVAIAQMSLFFPLALCALAAIVILFLIMILRDGLVVLLCAIAPIAIAMALLPNTAKWYKRWFNTLLSMLIIYPMVSLLFGACNLASALIATSSSGMSEFVLNLMAAAVAVVPLLITPFVVLKIFSAVPGIGGAVAGMANKKLKGRTKAVKQAAKRNYRYSSLSRGVNKARGAVAKVPGFRGSPAALRLAAAGAIADEAADKKDMELADDQLSAYSTSEQKHIAKTGKYLNGDDVENLDVWRAAIRKYGEKFDYDDNVTFAAALRDRPELQGRTEDPAQMDKVARLQTEALKAIGKSKHSMVPGSQNVKVARSNTVPGVAPTAVPAPTTPNAVPAPTAVPAPNTVPASTVPNTVPTPTAPTATNATTPTPPLNYREGVLSKLGSVGAQQFDSSSDADVRSFMDAAGAALAGQSAKPDKDSPEYAAFREGQREASAHVLDAAIDSVDRSEAGLTKPMSEKKRSAMQKIIDDGVKGKAEELASDKTGEKLSAAISTTTSDGTKSQYDHLLDDQLPKTSGVGGDAGKLATAKSDVDAKLATAADNYLNNHSGTMDSAVESELKRIRLEGTQRRVDKLGVDELTKTIAGGLPMFDYKAVKSAYVGSGIGDAEQFDRTIYNIFQKNGRYKGNAADRNLDAAMRRLGNNNNNGNAAR